MMTRFFIVLGLLFGSLTAFGADKTTTVFTLDHQMSSHCEKKIKENLRFEKGVVAIEVSLPRNTITIEYNGAKTDAEKLLAGFKKIGFNAVVIETLRSEKPQKPEKKK